MGSFGATGAMWQDCDDMFWDIIEKDAKRLTGRRDEFVDDDVKELARLYAWLYMQDTVPTRFPMKCNLMTNLCLDTDLLDEFECLIRHMSCLETWIVTEDSMVFKDDA
jgi:hypothetical protein